MAPSLRPTAAEQKGGLEVMYILLDLVGLGTGCDLGAHSI